VEPDQIVEPYDFTLTRLSGLQRQEWGKQVAAALIGRLSQTTPLCFFAGALYRRSSSPGTATGAYLPNPTTR
jgi:hypothetical protein